MFPRISRGLKHSTGCIYGVSNKRDSFQRDCGSKVLGVVWDAYSGLLQSGCLIVSQEEHWQQCVIVLVAPLLETVKAAAFVIEYILFG